MWCVRRRIRTESLLSIEESEQLNAEYISKLLLNTLDENNISSNNMISQYYDGTSVIIGRQGGMKT